MLNAVIAYSIALQLKRSNVDKFDRMHIYFILNIVGNLIMS